MNKINFNDMENVNDDYIEITEEFLLSGMQSGIACNNDQYQLLGVEIPAKKGWEQSIIGKKISKENAEKYLALKGVHKPKDRDVILSKSTTITNSSVKTDTIKLSNWESVTLYQLVKKEYCDALDVLPRTKENKELLSAYNKLMDKLEGAIAKTID